MKQAEIQVGGVYMAKVSGVVVPVRVDAIRDAVRYVGLGRGTPSGGPYRDFKAYDVTNLKTGRRTTFRSAAKFRRPVAKGEQL